MKRAYWLILLSIAGVLFSGYLTFSRVILGACPLNEPCSTFLGIPSCLIGFVLFSTLLILSTLQKTNLIKYISYVSLAGVIFALYSSIVDLFFTTCPGGCNYSLILPSCVYGLVFYLAIFVLSRKK